MSFTPFTSCTVCLIGKMTIMPNAIDAIFHILIGASVNKQCVVLYKIYPTFHNIRRANMMSLLFRSVSLNKLSFSCVSFKLDNNFCFCLAGNL